MSRLILVLGDQLTRDVAALREAGPDDVVVMAEVADEASYVPHHPKKIAFTFAAMRKFAVSLRDEGFTVVYTRLDDAQNAGSICGELLRRAQHHGASEVVATEPGEWRLIEALTECPLKVSLLEDDRFLASHAMFDAWARGRSDLTMEWFYRDMRRRTGFLMDGDAPVGGSWNYDQENRKSVPRGTEFQPPLRFDTDDTVREVLSMVDERFDGNFGNLHPFWFATDRQQAKQALAHFINHSLTTFGDYQDAMLLDDRFLSHSVLSIYLNAGLLGPLEVCRAVEDAWRQGTVPLNAAEGFIRQIIGWREYMRGIYFREGPDYTARNVLGHDRALPAFFWGAETRMECVSRTVLQTRDEAYAHHIQRLMVTGNFALLAGIDPAEVHEWYLSVYADAYEWVEAPNVIGMSQFADGGIVGSKPYVSSGNYIKKMSDYCSRCDYSPNIKTGDGACPFNLLYWAFLARHRDRFEGNRRMSQIYANWDRMADDKRHTILREAQNILDLIDSGETI